ncbi:DUF6415 family natural product biosynthesis protein [Streptomyces sp. NPDC087844]|uniref:DUF6415 family natural product biosynthesis protein n=1 Tax=Streptomyces sp. NPDC087844 TaxID=3365805 RepID=UPI0037FEA9FD
MKCPLHAPPWSRRLLAEDAELPTPDELETFTLQLRGHIMVAVPEVEAAAGRPPGGDVPRTCALARVGEARMRLGLGPVRTLSAGSPDVPDSRLTAG